MTKIVKLTEEMVSKIAAGEVVERPMNIVKELVENALDASATQINITIEDGGKKSVTISDNGQGIPRADLLIAFELHTTSKMSEGDPSKVSSLGFRGEALASIAAVSRIEVTSKSENDDKRRRLILEGGKVVTDTDIQGLVGTSISITSLFYNTPARRKFLKSAPTERKRITDLITDYCLMYPKIHFKLDEITGSNKLTTRIESPVRDNTQSVIYDVLGPDIAGELLHLDKKLGDWRLVGYISSPMINRSDRSLQFINVNGRPVKHKELQSAIESAYTSQLVRNTHPILILKITGPIDGVDFNIHPQKSEIRFKASEILIQEIPGVILETLQKFAELPSFQKNKLDRLKGITNKPTKSVTTPPKSQKDVISISRVSRIDIPHHIDNSPKIKTIQKSLFDEKILDQHGSVSVLGHIMHKFGVIYRNNELWLVDLHAADERVKYEMFGKSLARQISSQQFLEPMTIKLPPSEKQLILDHTLQFSKFGMKISNGGPSNILVHSIPIFYDQEITPKAVSDLINDFVVYLAGESGEHGKIGTALDHIEYGVISRLACHGSVRSGYPVSSSKINQIILELLECEFPWTCAHGRPTVIRFSQSKLESLFKR